jgi:hypothetical protein
MPNNSLKNTNKSGLTVQTHGQESDLYLISKPSQKWFEMWLKISDSMFFLAVQTARKTTNLKRICKKTAKLWEEYLQ